MELDKEGLEAAAAALVEKRNLWDFNPSEHGFPENVPIEISIGSPYDAALCEAKIAITAYLAARPTKDTLNVTVDESPLNILNPGGFKEIRITTARPSVVDGDLERDIELADNHLNKLLETGGRSWCLHIPARQDDVDLVFSRLIKYAKQLSAITQTEVKDAWQPMDSVPKDGRKLALLTEYTWHKDKKELFHDYGYWSTHNGGGWVHQVLGKIIGWADLPSLPAKETT